MKLPFSEFLPAEEIPEKETKFDNHKAGDLVIPAAEKIAPAKTDTVAKREKPGRIEESEVLITSEVKAEMELEQTAGAEKPQGSLLRNIFIFIGLFLVVVPLISFWLRKRAHK